MMTLQEMREKIRQALETQTYQGTLVLIRRTPENHRGAAKSRFYLTRIDGEWFVPLSWIEFPSMTMGDLVSGK